MVEFNCRIPLFLVKCGVKSGLFFSIRFADLLWHIRILGYYIALGGTGMDRTDIGTTIETLFCNCAENTVRDPEVFPEGLTLFEAPIWGVAAADDPLFSKYKDPDIIGPWYKVPREWLPDAKSVISIFFPFTERVRAANRRCIGKTATEWCYGRIEGQAFVVSFMTQFAKILEENGIKCCVPVTQPEFEIITPHSDVSRYGEEVKPHYSSSWAECHAAYTAGLGSFGLSKGLITRKGMAGRFGSLICNEIFTPDKRPYTGLYDYCARCGACARRCPASAISLAEGKDHIKCSSWISKTKGLYAPRYGCGLCQTGVPCERKIPLPVKSSAET